MTGYWITSVLLWALAGVWAWRNDRKYERKRRRETQEALQRILGVIAR